MIEYVKGELADLTPAMAVVDCHGVGYGVNISLNTYSAIQGKKEVKLYVHEAVREDAYVLWGFSSKQERELFLLLISVSGVGGNTARVILSSLTPSELVDVISSGNDKLLKQVKGIGLKTAQRIIVELKDKIVSLGITATAPTQGVVAAPAISKRVHDEAVSALTILGYPQSAASKAVTTILKANPDFTVEQVLKQAFKQL